MLVKKTKDGRSGWPGRWPVLAVSLLVQSVGGLFYAFGLYSDKLKQKFGLTQEDLAYIGTASNVGGNFGAHIGIVYDNYGPQPVLILAILLGLGGWLPMWYTLNSSWKAPYWALLVFAFLQGHGQMAGDLASVPTTGANFPNNRGLAIGLAKSFVGLSGALATQYFSAIFKDLRYKCEVAVYPCNGTRTNNTTTLLYTDVGVGVDVNVAYDEHSFSNASNHCLHSAAHPTECCSCEYYDTDGSCMKCQGYIPFILFIAFLILAICGTGVLFIRQNPPQGRESQASREAASSTLNRLVALVMFLALLCGASSFADEFAGDVMINGGKYGAMGIVIATFLSLLFYTSTRNDKVDYKSRDHDHDHLSINDAENHPLINEDSAETSIQKDKAEAMKMYTPLQALATLEFYCLFISFFIGVGSGMMLINNIAQMIEADSNLISADKTVFVTLISVCNCWGRLLVREKNAKQFT